jgi:hypothetical protein
MPYALRFYLYFFVACVVVTVVAVWLRPYGLLVSIAVACAEAYLAIIIYVHAGGASNTCHLVIEHENQNYNGSLVFDNGSFCRQIVELLKQYRGRSIKEIGDLQVNFTAE